MYAVLCNKSDTGQTEKICIIIQMDLNGQTYIQAG